MENEVKTYEQWKTVGFHIIKGMKSRSKTPDGVALFTFMQVEKNKTYYCYGSLDDMNDKLSDDPYYGCECF